MRVVCISDTHLQQDFEVPSGDVLIHSGDALSTGRDFREVDRFQSWFLELASRFQHTFFVPGNHDWAFADSPSLLRELLSEVAVLVDQGAEFSVYDTERNVYKQYSIYGTPSQPEFCNWAFNHSEDEMNRHYECIPEGVDFLVTHCPPFGILDVSPYEMKHVGSAPLLNHVTRVRPRYHIFGHIHHQGGSKATIAGTTFVNAAVCNERYLPRNPVVVLDVD